MSPLMCCRTACLMVLTFTLTSPTLADAWVSAEHPYRLQIELDQSLEQPAVLDISSQQVIDALQPVGVDQIDQETLAFEKTVLVNPDTGKVVGRFELVRVDEPLEIDGTFSDLRDGRKTWSGYRPDRMQIKPMKLGGETVQALTITEEKVTNVKLQQQVQLTPGDRYLLEYWLMNDTQDNQMGVMFNDPELRLFAQLPHSYFNKMPPRGEWARYQVIFRPKVPKTRLQVRPIPEDAFFQLTYAFDGRGGVADLRLQRVDWRLVVEPDQPLYRVEAYLIARAGHRLTEPNDDLIAQDLPEHTATIKQTRAQLQPLNPGGVLVDAGSASAWTIDPVLPLKVGAIKKYRPDGSVARARVDVFTGGSASLVIAVNNGQPRMDDLTAQSDLNARVTFHRLATVPVYDGPTVDGEVKGRLIETRYDPMVPLDYRVDPDSTDGIHLVLATITPKADMPAGLHEGQVTLRFDGQSLSVPVELNVAPMTVAAKRHFGTLFGGSFFHIKYKAGTANVVEDMISIARYHGFKGDSVTPPTIMSLSIPDNPDQRTLSIRGLAEKYYHQMLDYHVLPQSPALYAYFTYTINGRGPDKAPRLTDWDFSQGYDQAIEELVIGRDMPWLMVGRSNGHLMDHIRLSNNRYYSFKERPERDDWVHLPDDEFYNLVADYWDRFAEHLDKLGVLDRAIFVIDESAPSTYSDILRYVRAMRSRPYSKQIKIGHTTYKTATWLYKKDDGQLVMDEVLDVPMPMNDEHFNFFEHEWNQRFTKPGKHQWVYHVETDHMNLENAGMSTTVMPLKLRHLGVDGWYCWESFIWSIP